MKNNPPLTLKDAPVISDSVALQYTGFFSQTNIAAMAEVIRLYLEQHETSGSRRRRLFSTFIEMVQNILRYSADQRALVNSEV
ncbi:MAG: hypothetical protein XXXJIFNMEKO3_02740 [Candidatus Erwinia impunctatus]|nr:hypothetical protein XXXJIFNMEKO_02740 [Culicoides impunctatus]